MNKHPYSLYHHRLHDADEDGLDYTLKPLRDVEYIAKLDESMPLAKAIKLYDELVEAVLETLRRANT